MVSKDFDCHMGMDRSTDTAEHKTADKGSNNSLPDPHINTDLAVKMEVAKVRQHQFQRRHETDAHVMVDVRGLDYALVLPAHAQVQKIDETHSQLVFS